VLGWSGSRDGTRARSSKSCEQARILLAVVLNTSLVAVVLGSGLNASGSWTERLAEPAKRDPLAVGDDQAGSVRLN
jgi:hypothetical protein